MPSDPHPHPRGDARFDADGYQYGVRFGDGSIRAQWNGRTQRQRAEEEVELLSEGYAPDVYVLVRRKWGEPWREAEHPDLVRLRRVELDATNQGYTEGDVNHYVQPIIGMIRLKLRDGIALPLADMEYAVDRLDKACLAERAWLQGRT